MSLDIIGVVMIEMAIIKKDIIKVVMINKDLIN